jgi:hypothetical protein
LTVLKDKKPGYMGIVKADSYTGLCEDMTALCNEAASNENRVCI